MNTRHSENLSGINTDAAVGALLALESAAAGALIQKLGEHPFVINPHTGKPESLKGFLDKPLTIEANKRFSEIESFVGYVTQYKREGATIFGDNDDYTLQAILDYHRAPDGPEGCDHVATVGLTRTEALLKWLEKDGKPMSQLDFVEFLEERSKEIKEPSGAAILEIARDLHVVNGGECRSSIREGDEISVEFTKTEKIKAGGTVKIPTQFLVKIQPFDDQPQVIETIARLRVRARDGMVTFTFVLEDMRRHVREAFKTIAEKAGKAAAVPVFI